MNRIAGIAAIVALFVGSEAAIAACQGLAWDYSVGDEAKIDGFRFYEGLQAAGELPPAARSATCVESQLLDTGEPVTLVAFKGAQESPPSNEVFFSLVAPGGLRVEVSVTVTVP